MWKGLSTQCPTLPIHSILECQPLPKPSPDSQLWRSPLAAFFHVEPKILYLDLLDDFPSENESSTATHHLARRPSDWRGERRRAQPVNIWLPPWESRKTGYLGWANYSLDMPFCIPNFQPPPKTAEHHLPSDFPKSHCAGPGLIWFGSSVAGKPA